MAYNYGDEFDFEGRTDAEWATRDEDAIYADWSSLRQQIRQDLYDPDEIEHTQEFLRKKAMREIDALRSRTWKHR